MFQFEQTYVLWFLLLIPLAILLQWFNMRWKKTTLNQIGDYKVFSRLFSDWSIKKEWLKNGLIMLAFAFLLIACANPQWGNRKQKIKAKSSDVIIALDISQSMLAEDVSPNRMERSKRFVTQLIKSLRGERIGLIFFAGSAYLQSPLSNDYASADVYIKAASPKQAGTQGTVVAEAIELAVNIFGKDNPTQKALIIISDGENHETEAIKAAEKARENGTFIYTVGIGSQEGAYIPIVQNGKKVYKTDKSGQPITSALNVGLLQDIAEAGGGEFYMIDQTMTALKKIDREIDKIEKQDVEQRSFTDFNSYFQLILLMAIIFFILEFFIRNFSDKKGSLNRLLGI